MPAGPAGNNLDVMKIPEFVFSDVHLVEEDFSGFLRDSPEQGIAHGARLFKNFFLHEMFEAALFGHDGVPGYVLNGTIDCMAFEIHQMDALRSKHRYFAVTEKEDISRVLKNCGNVAGDKEFIFSQAYYDGRTEARGDDFQRIARGERDQRVGSAHHFHSFKDGFFERSIF